MRTPIAALAVVAVALVVSVPAAWGTAAPQVTGVTPSSGSSCGGGSVSIVGSGFTGATVVDFGAFVVGSFTVVDDSHITAVLPVGSSALVDVVVTTPGGSSAVTSADVFEDLPCITGVSPSSGATGGGTSVTITGHGFYGVTAVSFGATPATSFTAVSDTEMFATSPAGSGTVDITASFRGQASATSSADQFTYGTPAPAPPTLLSSFTPTSITAGGTSALAFTVTNPNASTALSGVGFTDTLPAGLTIATPNVAARDGAEQGRAVRLSAGGGRRHDRAAARPRARAGALAEERTPDVVPLARHDLQPRDGFCERDGDHVVPSQRRHLPDQPPQGRIQQV